MPFIPQRQLNGMPKDEFNRLISTHAIFGYEPETRDLFLVPDKDRYAATYVLGVTGAGKSGFLTNLIDHDITVGHAVIVLDPHGDLANDCMARVQPYRVVNTFVLDMEDEAHPFGLNVFASAGTFTTEAERTQAVERILHVFDVLWEDVLKQQNLPMLLRYATMTLLGNPGSTLVDMIQFFRDDVYRAKLLANANDESITEFFAHEFDNLTPAERARRIAPLMNRLNSLFVGRSLIRDILGQRKSSVDFRKAIEDREAIFIKLPTTLMKEDARLIGMFIMAEITAAIFSFKDTPKDQRPGVSLYVDEFQNFTTQDFGRLITEARKFGARLTIAHQYRDQLPSYLKDATKTVRNKVCFRTSADDAREMAQYFPSSGEEPIEPDTHASKYMLEQGIGDIYVQSFTEMYLRPLREAGSGKWVEIYDDGWSADKVFSLAFGMPRPAKIKEQNPVPYLDKLLYDVMKTGNPHIDIPAEIPVGFSNSSVYGFYQQALKARKELTSAVTFPMVVDTPDGPRFIRPPQDGHEQFYHFLFLLRMTMLYLAANPVGKSNPTKAADVAQMLTRLPNRAAFVRSGEDVGTIYTQNTPEPLTGEELQIRMEYIVGHSREKYCYPRDGLNGHPTPQPTPAPVPAEGTIDSNQPGGKPLSWFEEET